MVCLSRPYIPPNLLKAVFQKFYLVHSGILSPINHIQKQLPEIFYKTAVLENFAKFTEKHLRKSLLFNKVAGLSLQLY